ncbi:DUF4276 family protein [Meiothermus ruber]|jgi:hypothetical protein|uniref:DUF4276 family protein n=1 Tax=Meiothermus ruber (strain ATCC 35948 / DSM 1279 / VKM B-1258 / 21) TaxID=504728 RepID=D3PKR0_MEIRD|nr:DUF4276 family protein [Meiothermus ruber]ADD28934.1 hypothetical protein Mrub_2180 [Meiothermus ruber DSM 1279]AGK05617.1 hypothetical protein K649_11635 [Meiothermus ruber DSM 1279]MCL6528734.1 DUF4276 family protein [Meiothermus ruber]GAO75851.1 putative uncharacterized protein [Meiothermus ruber H328]
MKLAPIVEGHGEVEALPILIRSFFPSLQVQRPLRVQRNRFLNDPQERRRFLALAQNNLGQQGAILVLLDADEDCPAELAPSLLSQLRQDARLSCHLVLAKCEFETWFLAGADALGLGRAPVAVETIRGAKEEIKRRMGYYSETVDQPKLVARMATACDPHLLRERAPSFDKLWRELEKIANA